MDGKKSADQAGGERAGPSRAGGSGYGVGVGGESSRNSATTGIAAANNQATEPPQQQHLQERGNPGFGNDASDSLYLMLQDILDSTRKIIVHEEELQGYEDKLDQHQTFVDRQYREMTAAERQRDRENVEDIKSVASMQRTINEAREIMKEIDGGAQGSGERLGGESGYEGDTEEAQRRPRDRH